MKIFFFLFGFLLSAACLRAETVRVRILYSLTITGVNFIAQQGNYEIRSEDRLLHSFSAAGGDLIAFSLAPGGIRLTVNSNMIGQYASLNINGTEPITTFSIDVPGIPSARGLYDENLEVTTDGARIYLTNIVALDKYISSVLAGEIGYNAQPEFLKAKAIICRTYALSNPSRHADENFLLCSDTHCQVYKGKQENTIHIMHAVKATKGKIITDSSGKPILSVFHSNCGGYTQNSGEAWSSNLPYLKAVRDSFCHNQKNARWSMSFPAARWRAYFREHGTPVPSGEADTPDFLKRRKLYNFEGRQVSSRKIRNDWNLKSAWFVATIDGDSVHFEGRGYGHGVGLCQEGAMSMAEKGYSHRDIIHYYYSGVVIRKREK